jgi:hypothetical protein
MSILHPKTEKIQYLQRGYYKKSVFLQHKLKPTKEKYEKD